MGGIRLYYQCLSTKIYRGNVNNTSNVTSCVHKSDWYVLVTTDGHRMLHTVFQPTHVTKATPIVDSQNKAGDNSSMKNTENGGIAQHCEIW